ncbi:MAG: DEAD/DEAH box helicase family protein [Bacillota bacterium]|nr:DEAD/DEAH box helicase family protein [Bacillota bacterium]MDW7676593.1 DEAD/DEAH box helicase family protein [Bacillota bacterium]
MKYSELLEKYRMLEEENRILKDEINRLKRKPAAGSPSFLRHPETAAQYAMAAPEHVEPAAEHAGPITDAQFSSCRHVTQNSSSHEKISLFLSLFKGRADVCAKRWKNKPGYSPYCYHDFKRGICEKPRIKCAKCSNSAFAPLNHEEMKKHLLGEHVLGLYPLTPDDTCYLLVMDFDEATWQDDIAVVRRLCRENGIPVYAERSRSGNGCHLWFFFEKEMKASIARKFGSTLLDLAMQESNNIRFDSYDRLVPSQDFLQKDGFGNLIALPLQKEARMRHNSVFIDEALEEIEDQWQYLSQVSRISEEFITAFVKSHKTAGAFSEFVREEVHDHGHDSHEDDLYRKCRVEKNDFPETLVLKRGTGIEISKQGISSRGLHFLRKLASYANPEFYAKQAMRQSTYGTPRVTVMYAENEQRIVLPRGIEETLCAFLDSSNIDYSVMEQRFSGRTLEMTFLGQLNQHQEQAFSELNNHNNGVLSATTGFGKTVIGARIIAEKAVPTLILVHTKELADQWKERLEHFLAINESVEKKRKNASIIGQLGGGKKTRNGIVDIAIMQSMFEKDKTVKPLIKDYGLIIADECHHVSAVNFSKILSEAHATYVYGLTATPVRKDGHHPIIFMLCGPVRYKVDARQEAKRRDFDHYVVPRFTSTRMPTGKRCDEWHITEVYQHLCESTYRNQLIVTDVEQAIQAGRNPLVITERTSHIELLAEMMKDKDFEVIQLSGSLKAKDRRAAVGKIRFLHDRDRYVIVATGKLIGEGFDEARLDTLFMALPIAWKGTVAQYAGRLHRRYEGKEEVLIYDYVDVHIPVMERMYHKRLTAYRSVGYSMKACAGDVDVGSVIYNESNYLEQVMGDIKNAGKDILISSPYVQKRKVDSMKGMLLDKYKAGVRVTVCIKALEDYTGKQKGYVEKFINEMVMKGANVLQVPQNRYTFMIIDNRIVWYGGVDILGGGFNEGSMIRLQNEELAHELMGAISE